MNNTSDYRHPFGGNFFPSLKLYSPQIAGFFYTFAVTLSTVYCLISSQELPVSHPAVVLCCILFSFGLVVFHSFRLHLYIRAGIYGTLLLLFVVFIKQIFSSFYVAFVKMFYISDSLYGTVVDENTTSTLFIVIIALCLAWITSLAIMRRHTLWYVFIVSASICVFSCSAFVSLPATWSLLLYFGAMIMLIVTQRVRVFNAADSAVQSLRILPAAILLVLVLALITDPVGNTRPEFLEKLQNKSGNFFWDIGASLGFLESRNDDYYASAEYENTVDLSELSPQKKNGLPVMSVYSESEVPTLYLRGESYAGYSDNKWFTLSSSYARYINECIPSPLTEQYNATITTDNVQIRMVYDSNVIYLPYNTAYAPEGSTPYGDAFIENSSSLMEYTLQAGPYRNRSTFYSEFSNDPYDVYHYIDYVEEIYLGVPDHTKAQLLKLAYDEEIITYDEYMRGGAMDIIETARKVERFIENTAEYSLDSGTAPEGEDFAVWFIRSADTGYCVHFASSAAVMLRSLGIPARYVTGYMVQCSPYQWTTVLSDDAHAWVEYYTSEQGWVPIDPTPASFDTQASGGLSSVSDSSFPSEDTIEPSDSDSLPSNDLIIGQTKPTAPDGNSVSSSAEAFDDSVRQDSAACTVPWLVVVPFLSVAAIITALILLRKEVLGRRHERFTSGSYNRRVTAMWDYIILLERCGGIAPTRQIKAIMLRARFSQHTITDEELCAVAEHLDASLAAALSAPRTLSYYINRYIRFYF